jgi:hypothetical protein
MSYVVSGLPVEDFAPLFGLSDSELAARGAERITASDDGFYPCRVTLQDAAPGETLLLLNHEHQPAQTPYRSRHAIFVREAAGETARLTDSMPAILSTRRLMALRAFDAGGRMIAAETVPGPEVEATALRLLDNPKAAYLHAHNPAWGCWAARIDRA